MTDASPSKLDRTGIIYGIIGAALFSTKPILIKYIYEYGVETTVLMTLRMAFSLPFYLAFGYLAIKQRSAAGTPTDFSIKTLGLTALIGINGYYLASFLDLEGLNYITAQFERLILFTYPVFVVILGALFFGRKITMPTIISLSLTYAGLAVVFTHDLQSFGDDILKGALLVLAAAFSFAGYVVFSKDQITKLGARLFTCFAMIAASFAIGIHFAIFSNLSALDQPWQVYGLVLLIAIFATVIPTFFIAEAIARIGPGPASILGSAGPIFTILMATSLLGEVFTASHLVGTVLIVAGVAWLAWPRANPKFKA